MADNPIPLCTAAQFRIGPFGDLVSAISAEALTDFLAEATRECEDEVDRRLVPFTVTETHRAEGIDPDEVSDAANLPMDIRSTLGASYAAAIGAGALVRHCWLDEKAHRYSDLWSYSNVTISIIRSYGGSQSVPAAQVLNGPEPDTGHLWFQLGIFLPVGSRIQVTYSGGYTVAIPASLVRAGKFMCASNIVRELNPASTDHNPAQLRADALAILSKWAKN